MTTPPQISLITPCLNAEKTIERTLRSIEQQHYSNLQMICVDGGSSDKTPDIIARYGKLVSVFISERDKNVADALNKGFRRADGEIYCYLNSDDALAPGTLKRVAEIFTDEPDVDVITGGCLRVFADGSQVITQVPPNFLQTISMRNDMEQPSTFWRAKLHRLHGPLDDTYNLAFDWEWWNRLHLAGAQFKRVSDTLSIYYFSDDNLTSRAGQRAVDEMYRITKQYGPFRGRIADVYRLLYWGFDMSGCYDRPFHSLPWRKKLLFGASLKLLYAMFGRQAINSYNWNWAAKQVRGLTWYR